ncbi:uroporphyrinogen-III C-methyltransferase [Massilia yuzhufengensis]|uniref:Uroporphyrin-3 C-methyltransferase/uroporphyrinogen III methyltransferase / synthase n=1 Tax=Massilia yuzhufengensis TaxID=1164594 RepID=A0A1I1EVD1_9BURK|nr:uroporphyrinogen-III C-methyltransferase [Massilia yuzhufengensis]SFB91129.1 uroporphyrin-3 C-methyltransferase/uroporphyrinogen III methyltransferase / synthase [Massilia yuzhufengensis]
MNEIPNNPEPIPAASVVVQKAPLRPQGQGLLQVLQRPLPMAVAVLALLLAVQTVTSHNRINSLRKDMAQSLQKGNAVNAETAAMAREVSDTAKELQIKVGVLESRQAEAQTQQLALEQLYQDLSKNRDEWALTEIEQVLSTASQQLQLAGNVPGALIALQNADRSLGRSDKPQFLNIRRAIGADIERLKAMPAVDLAGVALRLDSVIAHVDTLPMLSDEKPLLPAAPLRSTRAKKDAKEPAPEALSLGQRMTQTWRNWSQEMWDDVRQLVRVRSVETPEALMLSPTESFFVRENLKLRLLNARMALLSRNEASFRDDLNSAQEILLKYFDTRARATQSAQGALRQVQANNLTIEMPTLSGSLDAVRNYKAKQ